MTVNLILTIRKAVSLGISVGYYGTGVTPGLGVGSAMVLGTLSVSLERADGCDADPRLVAIVRCLAGTMLYSFSSSPPTKTTTPTKERETGTSGSTSTPAPTETYDIVVKRDDSANNPAEKVEPEVMLHRMREHATQVRERRGRVVGRD